MVFGLFSKERSLQRAMAKATNKYAQTHDRFAAMEKLRSIGTDDALYALLQRFSFNYDKTIDDEQEKQWVYETLCDTGPKALPALRRYVKRAASVAYPLRVVENVCTSAQALELVDELLADEAPGYTRDPTRRIQIIDWLADFHGVDDAAIVDRVGPYVADFDENVRFSAIEALGLHPADNASEPLLDRLLDEEEESNRLKRRIVEVLAQHKLNVGSRKHELTPLLGDLLANYKIQHEKLVKK